MEKWWWMNWGWKKIRYPTSKQTKVRETNTFWLVLVLVSAVFENPGALVICFKQMNRLDMSEKNDASSFPILATRCKKNTIWRDTPSSFLHTENEAVILSGHFLKYHSKLGTSPSLGGMFPPVPVPWIVGGSAARRFWMCYRTYFMHLLACSLTIFLLQNLVILLERSMMWLLLSSLWWIESSLLVAIGQNLHRSWNISTFCPGSSQPTSAVICLG